MPHVVGGGCLARMLRNEEGGINWNVTSCYIGGWGGQNGNFFCYVLFE